MESAEDRRLKQLEARVKALEKRLDAATAPVAPETKPAPTRSPTWVPVSRSWDQAPGPAPHATAEDDDWSRPAEPSPAAGSSLYAAPEPRAPREPFRFDAEKVLGARWLARAGVLVLALGVVFFLKLAYDREWVPIVGRFFIALLSGLGIFALGDFLRTRRIDPAFAQILAGGGAVISYVTIYLAWVFTDYRSALHLTLPAEISMLAGASALLGAYSVWRNLPFLAGVAVAQSAILIAPAGAFGTVGLLYVAFLQAAFLAAAAWRGWGVIVLMSTVAANLAHLLALLNGVEWSLVLASSALLNFLAVAAAHRVRESPTAGVPTHDLVGALAPSALFVTAGIALGRADLVHPWGWAALAVATASLAGALASPRMAPSIGAVGALLLLGWPPLQFPSELWQVLAYVAMGGSALAIPLAMPRATRWALTFAGAAAALGAGSLLLLAIAQGVVQTAPWQAGLLALSVFALGAAQWYRGRGTGPGEVPMAGLGVAAAMLLLWPFLQFTDSLWQTFTLATSSAVLCAFAAMSPIESRTVRTLASAACAVAVGSILLMAAAHGAAEDQPYAAGALAIFLFGLGVALWWLGRQDAQDSTSRWAGLAVAGVMLVLWPFVQFPDSLWQTFTLAAAGAVLFGAGIAWGEAKRIAHLFALAASVTAIGSLLLLAAIRGAVGADPVGSSSIALTVAALGAGLWWSARRGRDDTMRACGLAVTATVGVIQLGYLLDGWAVAVAWAVEGIALAVAGLSWKDIEVRLASFALFALVLGRVFLVDLRNLSLELRVLTFIFTGALLLLAAFLFARQRKDPAEPKAE